MHRMNLFGIVEKGDVVSEFASYDFKTQIVYI